jgi:acyl-CoA thioesterase
MIRLFGIEVEETSERLTRVSAVVREDFLQLHELAHGAFIFALLDVAFALTVNAKLDAVAVQWSISQFRSAKLGGSLPNAGAVRRAPPDGGRPLVTGTEVG